MKKHLLFCFLACLAAHGTSSAQELLELNTERHCSYSGVLESDLFAFELLPPVPELVALILQHTGSTQNFTLLQSNVETVAAILSDGKRYLLYSQDYYLKLPREEKAVAVGLLAHEIGHHLSEHTFDPAFREKEELEADLFMGYALSKTPGIQLLQSALQVAQKVPFSHPFAPEKRQKAIETGWRRAEDFVRGQENLAYYETEANAANSTLAIPRFPWPPPQCAQRQTLAEQLQYKGCQRLGDVDQRLRQALHQRGYDHFSYFQTPNGFAIATQLEQFNANGTSKTGSARWTDYPVPEHFDGLWNYLKSLVMPTAGYFRVFVFVVTDTPYHQQSRKVSKEEAAGWLSQGFNRLPRDIADATVTGNHYLDVLVYEFEAPQSTKRCAQKCPCLIGSQDHLNQSGLYKLGF
jgi:hypothetical protein